MLQEVHHQIMMSADTRAVSELTPGTEVLEAGVPDGAAANGRRAQERPRLLEAGRGSGEGGWGGRAGLSFYPVL